MKLFTLSALSLFTSISWAQGTLLYNSGATVKIEAGAVLYVEGGVHNLMGGTIDNDGTLEIKGNFLNEAIWEPSQPNTLKFSGGGQSDLTPGSAVFQDVVIQKDAGNNVNLLGTMTVNDSLIFSAPGASRIVTNDFDVKLGPTAKVAGYDSDEYVATTGTLGMMEKAVTAGGTFEFPVGDLTIYSPLTSLHSGGYGSSNLRVRANNLTHPNKPADATEYISRYWDVNATGITSYSNTLTGTYNTTDDLVLGAGGLASQVKGAVYDGTEWSYVGAASGANTVIGITNDAIADLTGTNSFGKVSLKVFLAGTIPTSTNNPPMTTTLNTPTQLIPLNTPYDDAPWNAPSITAASIPANTTDWILVETRDPSINILTQTSAFLKSDGTIVNYDGGSLLLKNATSSAIISIRHRNHLGIRTINALDLVASPTTSHDFSTGTGQAWTNPSLPPPSTNANMRLVGTTYCMWGGNANLTGTSLTLVRYLGLGNEPQAILNAMGNNNQTPLNNSYHNADLNLNRNVSYLGLNNDPAVVLNNINNNNQVITAQHLP